MYGNALKQLIIIEFKSYLSYRSIDQDLTYWRSTSKIKVDTVIGDSVAIYIKAKSIVSNKDANGPVTLSEEIPFKRKIMLPMNGYDEQYKTP